MHLSPRSSLPQEPRLRLYWLQTQARQRAATSATEFAIPLGYGSAPRIPLLKRAVVLALNWHTGLSLDAITIRVHLNAETAR